MWSDMAISPRIMFDAKIGARLWERKYRVATVLMRGGYRWLARALIAQRHRNHKGAAFHAFAADNEIRHRRYRHKKLIQGDRDVQSTDGRRHYSDPSFAGSCGPCPGTGCRARRQREHVPRDPHQHDEGWPCARRKRTLRKNRARHSPVV